jgi:hypothetical protein
MRNAQQQQQQQQHRIAALTIRDVQTLRMPNPVVTSRCLPDHLLRRRACEDGWWWCCHACSQSKQRRDKQEQQWQVPVIDLQSDSAQEDLQQWQALLGMLLMLPPGGSMQLLCQPSCAAAAGT